MNSKTINKIFIFTGAFRSPTGLMIALATRCQFVHAAVSVAGECWHSSEQLGRFDRVDLAAYAERDCIMFEFEGDLSQWLEGMKGCRYDWRGVLGWLFRMNNPQRFYCFEAAQDALKTAGIIQSGLKRLSGCDLRDMAKGGIRYGKFKDLC